MRQLLFCCFAGETALFWVELTFCFYKAADSHDYYYYYHYYYYYFIIICVCILILILIILKIITSMYCQCLRLQEPCMYLGNTTSVYDVILSENLYSTW